ncbi:hypothetical protein [Variovorax sp. HJSM1_2]|uniref:hypothetical protein n=1 Tax=Variovorax sp. HJSM1_2 TaxID=3366263 RepID=UPI003BBBF6BB
MWKIIVGFAVFAALAVFLLMKGGDIDMTGEKHGGGSVLPAEKVASLQTVSA